MIAAGREARGITISDWLAMVAGIAFCWSIPSQNLYHPLAPWLPFLFRTLASIPVALVCVGVLRQLRFNRAALPGEWFFLVFAAQFLAGMLPNVDTSIDWFHRTYLQQPWREGFSEWRWSLVGLVVLICLPALLLLNRVRMPAWLRDLARLALLTALVWCPISVFSNHLDLPIRVAISNPLTIWSAICLQVLNAIRVIPSSLLLSWATVFAISGDRRERQSWPWNCWFAAVLALLELGLASGGILFKLIDESNSERVATLLVLPPLGALCALLSVAMVAWSRTRSSRMETESSAESVDPKNTEAER